MNQQFKELSEIIQDTIDYIQAVAEGKQPPTSRQHARQVLEEAAVQLPEGEMEELVPREISFNEHDLSRKEIEEEEKNYPFK